MFNVSLLHCMLLEPLATSHSRSLDTRLRCLISSSERLPSADWLTLATVSPGPKVSVQGSRTLRLSRLSRLVLSACCLDDWECQIACGIYTCRFRHSATRQLPATSVWILFCWQEIILYNFSCWASTSNWRQVRRYDVSLSGSSLDRRQKCAILFLNISTCWYRYWICKARFL